MSYIKWQHHTPPAANILERTPELIAAGTVVKANAVRKVIKSGDYFIKIDLRPTHPFTGEFAIAQALTGAGIPVVEHLACGSDGNANYLITRALPDAVELAEMRDTIVPDEKFLHPLCDFLTAFANSNFIHNDFHCGNILYANGRFTLVDVRAVRRKWWWDQCRLHPGAFHPLAEFRSRLSASKMQELFTRCGIRDARKFYRRMWQECAAALFKEWEKRKTQLFAAYPKFSTLQGDKLCRTRSKVELSCCREFTSPLAAEVFALGLFLELAGIPSSPVVAVDLANQKYFLAPAGNGVPGAAAISEADENLACFKLSLPPELWGLSPDGMAAVTSPEAMEHLAKQLPLS